MKEQTNNSHYIPEMRAIWITNFCGGIRKFISETDARKHAASLESLSGIPCQVDKIYVKAV